MSLSARQTTAWSGAFGRAYTDRNARTLEEEDRRYRQTFGFTRTELDERFLGDMNRSARILEVGCNIGNQLRWLQRMGFARLCGVELQAYAIELARARTSGIQLVAGSARDLPFGDGRFDLVFTSGVLIHIQPSGLADVMCEIHRCTRRYIWGFEYWSEDLRPVEYRGEQELLWKADYAKLYLDQFDDLRLVQTEYLTYADSDNVDRMFLLERRQPSPCK